MRRGFREPSPWFAACWAGVVTLGGDSPRIAFAYCLPSSPKDPLLPIAILPKVRAACVSVVIATLGALLT